MKFAHLSKLGFVSSPTPLESCSRFGQAVGHSNIWIKRDDLLPHGGNKARKLDYILAQAVSQKADTIITASTNQCNHNFMTLMMGRSLGMKTQIIMESWGEPSYEYSKAANRVLYELGDVERVEIIATLPTGPVEKMPLVLQMAEEVKQKGGTPFLMPRGGMGPLGACGYIQCVQELQQQYMQEPADVIVCACGLGGMQAGLLMGIAMLGLPTRVIGVGVTSKTSEEMEQSVYFQCCEIAQFLEDAIPILPKQVFCVDEYSLSGYAKPDSGTVKAINQLAQTEGILADPVYSGKALAGLIGLLQSGKISDEEKVVFIHSGGLSSYYNYSKIKIEGGAGIGI